MYEPKKVYTVCAWNTVSIMNQEYVTVDAKKFVLDDNATDQYSKDTERLKLWIQACIPYKYIKISIHQEW